MSLRLRFAATAGLAVALVVVALSASVYAAARSELRGELDSALVLRAGDYLAHDHDHDHAGGSTGDGDRRAEDPPPVAFGGANGSFQVIARSGAVTRPTGETALPVSARDRRIAHSGSGRSFADATVNGVHLRLLTVGTGAQGALQVARPLTETDHALRQILTVLIALGAAGVVLAGLLGGFVARTALAPVRRFTARTEALVHDPDLSHRLEERGRDELGRLARSFNESLAALERSLHTQRQLVADASHELRTPIASLRANIQMFEEAQRLPPEERAGLQSDILAELDELTALVSDIAELARGAPPHAADDDVRLDLIVDSLVERFERRARDGVHLEARLDETLVRADPERLSRAASNLLDNAVKWSPAGSTVEISLHDGVLEVRDHGPGFAAEDLPHVFDRFYRSSTARGMSGSGLGLAIVRQIVEAAGGSVSAANADGGGALVRASFR